MITLRTTADINWQTVQAVAYENEPLKIDDRLIDQVEAGRLKFEHLIEQGVPCYGVTTGLGQLVLLDLTEEERADLPRNILRARAAAVGPPIPKPVVRALMMMRLVNFLSGLDGVTTDLCQFVVDRLNDGFTPWVPSFGHGMAADATAQTHTFQTFIGEGFVWGNDGERLPAAEALDARGVAPLDVGKKEGLAMLNGISAAPAYALDAHRQVSKLLDLATAIAAVSSEGGAVPKDSFDSALKSVSAPAGVHDILDRMQPLLRNSQVTPYNLQAPISFRIIPQVHGALGHALTVFQEYIEGAIRTFSDNPLMVTDDSAEGGRFLSVGLFHNQLLVNQADQVALALAHVAALSVRRLHRLMNPQVTGLNPQLAARPGLDAGLVVAHKAATGVLARLKLLANPVSLMTGETSGGQEDYMSMAFPTISRLYEMVDLAKKILAYECLGGLTALTLRGEQPGEGVTHLQAHFSTKIMPLTKDRSPGPDVETILQIFETDEFESVVRQTQQDNI
ncbi:MAG: aromatic amino acid lyase [Chloroflexota bacterium]